MQKVLQIETVEKSNRQEVAAVEEVPTVAESRGTTVAHSDKKLRQAPKERSPRFQFWGQVGQTAWALIVVAGYVFMMRATPSTVGAIAGVGFVGNLIFRCLVWQHYFRTRQFICEWHIGNPLRFYVLPALILTTLSIMVAPLLQVTTDEDAHLWVAGIFSLVGFVVGALFFVRLGILTLRQRGKAQ